MTKQEAIQKLNSLKRIRVATDVDGWDYYDANEDVQKCLDIAIECIEKVIQAEEHAQPMVDLIQMLGDDLGDYDWSDNEDMQPTISQWIPVIERLPDGKEDSYLVTRTDGKFTWVEEGDFVIDEFLFIGDEYRFNLKRKIENIAWMPLPEPYKEEE